MVERTSTKFRFNLQVRVVKFVLNATFLYPNIFLSLLVRKDLFFPNKNDSQTLHGMQHTLQEIGRCSMDVTWNPHLFQALLCHTFPLHENV